MAPSVALVRRASRLYKKKATEPGQGFRHQLLFGVGLADEALD
jgi:hypothetical protein